MYKFRVTCAFSPLRQIYHRCANHGDIIVLQLNHVDEMNTAHCNVGTIVTLHDGVTEFTSFMLCHFIT